MIDAPTFRTDYPEFANTTTFPDSLIDYWIGIGTMMLTPRWGPTAPPPVESPSVSLNFYDYGLELYVAHNVALEALAQQASTATATGTGAIGGRASGPIAATTVGDVSVQYGIQMTGNPEDGPWNYTIYGQRFIRLAKMVGGGGFYFSPGRTPYDPYSSGNAWPGVLVGTPPWWT